MDYEGCLDQNHCFGYPEGCVNNKNCDMMARLKMSGDKVDVQLTSIISGEFDYVAMAFSDDDQMGKDLVFACNDWWNTKYFINVNMFWNEGRSQPSNLLKEIGDTVGPTPTISSSFQYIIADEKPPFLICTFTLEKEVTIRGKRFDFEEGHHILLATGKTRKDVSPFSDDTLIKHDKKVASKSKFGKHENQTGTYIVMSISVNIIHC